MNSKYPSMTNKAKVKYDLDSDCHLFLRMVVAVWGPVGDDGACMHLLIPS